MEGFGYSLVLPSQGEVNEYALLQKIDIDLEYRFSLPNLICLIEPHVDKKISIFSLENLYLGGHLERGAHCVELELRWQFCVHGNTCPDISNQSFE